VSTPPSSRLPEALARFIDAVPETDTSLLVVNRTGPEPLVDLLRAAFETQSVTVSEGQLPDTGGDVVLLVRGGAVVASTPMERLRDSFLLVNTDRYRTGPNGLVPEAMPDVLTDLAEIEFHVRGFPASNKEKLLLVLVSRFIEARALERGAGRLDVSFQRLSRIDSEHGTRRVYERLSATDLELHVYGVPDQPVPDPVDATVHTGTDEEYRRSWFVVYRPPGGTAGHVGLVAVEVGENVWRSMWTYDQDRVERIGDYVGGNL
jgi:hypothetical protein